MMMRDVKDGVWPSTRRRRAERRSKTVWQGIALAAAMNLSGFCISILAPHGLWLALFGLVVGCIATALMVKNILDEA